MTHGTPHDHPTCTTDLSCNNHRTNLMTCREAAIRYAGDYAYRKQVDAGTATLEKPVFTKPERAKVPRAPRLRPKQPRQTSPQHGTESGYVMFKCRDDRPAEVSCRQVASEAHRLRVLARKAAA